MKKIILAVSVVSALWSANDFTNSIGMKFIEIPTGSFMMGQDPNFEDGDSDELPRHKVDVESFYIQTTEVTQSQWVSIMGNNPSKFKGRTNPVEQVSWYDAKSFVKKLNQKEKTDKYRLCTEEEWEYAARAGSSTKYFFGDDELKLGEYAWYYKNSKDKTHPVAKKKPNKWGLYDILGNVSELTSSCYTKSYDKGCFKNYKVSRGANWYHDADNLRSSFRMAGKPDTRSYLDGFRLCKTK